MTAHCIDTEPPLGRDFLLLWLGESIYGFGGALLQFALGVWIYRETGSPVHFAQIYMVALLPCLAIMPWAGAIADSRWRRWVILTTDGLATLIVLGLAGLLQGGRLDIDYLYATSAVSGALMSLRLPSYQAAISLMVPASRLTRATALSGLSQASASMLAPLLGGALMARYGLAGITTCLSPLMIAGMLVVFIGLSRNRRVSTLGEVLDRKQLVRGAIAGLMPAVTHVSREPLLVRLLAYCVVHDALLILASAMLTPLILSTHTSTSLGMVYAAAAVGGAMGAGLLALTNARHHVMTWLLLGNLCLALCISCLGLQPRLEVTCGCIFFGLFAGAAAGHLAATLWARKVPEAIRGSVFSLVAFSRIAVSCAVLWLGGHLSERVFQPALRGDGSLARSLGAWLGPEQGRGLGLLFIVIGVASSVITLTALARKQLRGLDVLVPDVESVSVTSHLDAPTLAQSSA